MLVPWRRNLETRAGSQTVPPPVCARSDGCWTDSLLSSSSETYDIQVQLVVFQLWWSPGWLDWRPCPPTSYSNVSRVIKRDYKRPCRCTYWEIASPEDNISINSGATRKRQPALLAMLENWLSDDDALILTCTFFIKNIKGRKHRRISARHRAMSPHFWHLNEVSKCA